MDVETFTSFDWYLFAQRGRSAASGIVLLFALFQWLAGLAAIVGGALLWVVEKTEESFTWAAIVAFGGGAWCGFGWFGWPFLTKTATVQVSPGGYFTQPLYESVTESTFSIFALLGNGVFGVLGFLAMFMLVSVLAPELVENDNENGA